MKKRTFYVALGVPRGVDTQRVRVAYRKLVTRYRRELEAREQAQPERFAVLRSYSERRHAGLFEPEPLIPQPRANVDEVFGGVVPDVVAPPSTARRATPSGKDLFVELRLGSDEARRGGLFPVHIPVVKPCRTCADWEERDAVTCPNCHGKGRITEDRVVEVATPPGVRHGQGARVAMEDVGLAETDLIIHVIIG